MIALAITILLTLPMPEICWYKERRPFIVDKFPCDPVTMWTGIGWRDLLAEETLRLVSDGLLTVQHGAWSRADIYEERALMHIVRMNKLP